MFRKLTVEPNRPTYQRVLIWYTNCGMAATVAIALTLGAANNLGHLGL